MSDVLHDIEAYFHGQLQGAEKEVFERRCLSNPAFARMVAFYISLQEHLSQQWREQKKQEFARVDTWGYGVDGAVLPLKVAPGAALSKAEEEEEEVLHPSSNGAREGGDGLLLKGAEKVRHIRTWRRVAVAAALLGVVALSIILYVQSSKEELKVVQHNAKGSDSQVSGKDKQHSGELVKTPTAAPTSDSSGKAVQKAKKDRAVQEEPPELDGAEQQALYASNFQLDSVPDEQPGGLEEAFAYYESGAYQAAIAALERTKLASEVRGEEAEEELAGFYGRYYKGLSYMALDSLEKAIVELGKAKSGDAYLKGKKQWYLALAYLRTGQLGVAYELLGQLRSNKGAGPYRQKAQELLTEWKGK